MVVRSMHGGCLLVKPVAAGIVASAGQILMTVMKSVVRPLSYFQEKNVCDDPLALSSVFTSRTARGEVPAAKPPDLH